MSSETLSQNEIDALLGGKGGAAAPAGPVAPPPDAQVYDFRRPHRVSKEKLRTLEAMYERFAKSLEGWLIGRVRGQVALTLQSIEQYSFGEFTLSLPTPCASYVFDITDSGGQQGVVDFGAEFAYFLVDRLFGGSGTPTILDRALTPIERMAVRVVAERVLANLAEVWQDYVELDLALSGFESVPDILRAANPEDPVLVANVQVAAADTRSLLLVCLPFPVLEKFFAGGSERKVTIVGSAREQEANRARSERALRAARVPVHVRLPDFQLSMRELASLAEGGVLATGLARTAPLEVYIAEHLRYTAAPGRIGHSLAVRLLDSVATADDAAPPVSSPL